MKQTPLQEMQDKISEAAETLMVDMELSFRPMFGGVSGYVKGRVFVSLSNIGLALKLSAEDQNSLLQEPEAKRLQYGPDEPLSKQYIVVPNAIQNNNETLVAWVKRSVEFVLAQPPPKPKQKK